MHHTHALAAMSAALLLSACSGGGSGSPPPKTGVEGTWRAGALQRHTSSDPPPFMYEFQTDASGIAFTWCCDWIAVPDDLTSADAILASLYDGHGAVVEHRRQASSDWAMVWWRWVFNDTVKEMELRLEATSEGVGTLTRRERDTKDGRTVFVMTTVWGASRR